MDGGDDFNSKLTRFFGVYVDAAQGWRQRFLFLLDFRVLLLLMTAH